MLLFTAITYGCVGWLVGARRCPGEHASALAAFRMWWWGLSVALLAACAAYGAAWVGLGHRGLLTTLLLVTVLGHAVALVGVTMHLCSIYDGRRRATWALAMGAFHFGFFATALHAALPVELDLARDTLVFAMGTFETDGMLALLLGAFFLPHVLASFCYAALLVGIHGRTERYRLVLVSWSLLLTAVSFVFLATRPAPHVEGVEPVLFAAAFVAPSLLVFAYAPPPWVQRQLGVAPLVGFALLSSGSAARRRRR